MTKSHESSDDYPAKSIATEPASLDDATLASLWNHAYPDDLALSARLMAWCRETAPGRSVAVRVHERAGAHAAFVIASALAGQATGWIDALAVPLPRAGRRIRLPLLAAAESWLRKQGCTSVRLGGGPWSLLRGVPAPLRRQRLLLEAGYKASLAGPLNDMAFELPRYTPLAAVQEVAGVVQPAQPRDVENIRALLAEPDRLLAAADEDVPQADQFVHLQRMLDGGRLGDLMLLWTAHGLEGLCQIIFPDSALPVERTFPWTLPRPWSALGPVLARKDIFSWGAGALVDASLRRLHNNGINVCVAPSITRTTTWEEYGFRVYRRWQPFIKPLP